MKKICVYSGESVQHLCGLQSHPYNEVLRAQRLVKSPVDITVYSNCPDFVSAVKYLGELEGVETEFFLDGVSHGSDIEPLFCDFNRALDLIHRLTDTNKNTG